MGCPSPPKVAPFLQALLRALPQPAGHCSFPVVPLSSFVCPAGGSLDNLFRLDSCLGDKNDSGNQPFNEHLLCAGSHRLSHFLLTITRRDPCDILTLKRGNLRLTEAK